MSNSTHAVDFAHLRTRWVDIITSRTHVRELELEFREFLDVMRAEVEGHLELLDPAMNGVFIDAPLDTNAGIQTTYQRIKNLAVAWATPGTTHFDDTALLSEIIDGVRVANTIGYNPGIPEYGNWWTWEVGASFNLANTLVLVYDHLTDDDIARNCAAIDFYVPDPWFSKPAGKGRAVTTGTGRVNLCKSVIVRSLLDGNFAKFAHARAGLAEGWQTVGQGNGFYSDGSYVTHNAVAYNGSYGVEMPKGLADLFALLEPLDGGVPGRDEFFNLIERAFIPIVYRGQVLDCLRGRSITRSELRSKDETAKLIEAIVKMSVGVDDVTAARWIGRCKSWLADLGGTLPRDSISRIAAERKLKLHPAPPLPEPCSADLFNSMDRVLVRQPGWAFSISGSSKRIAFYEPGNGENPRGFYTGAGMTTLYNDDVEQFDDDFWPTVDWYRLPGTTSDQLRLPDKTGGSFGRALCDGEWTGGGAIHRDGAESVTVFAQHIVGLGDTGLRARKFWFIHDGVIVALGSGIYSRSGAPVETVVENRNLHSSGANKIVVDGTVRLPELGASVQITGSRWAHLAGVGGYHFGAGSTIGMVREQRTGSWSDINTNGPTGEITRRFLSLWLQHGDNPKGASYEYALLPGATKVQTEVEAVLPRYKVLSNDETVQSAQIGPDVRGFAFWEKGSVEGVSANGPGTVLIKDDGLVRTVAVTPHGDGKDFIVDIESNSRLTLQNAEGAHVSKSPVGVGRAGTSSSAFRICVLRTAPAQQTTVTFDVLRS